MLSLLFLIFKGKKLNYQPSVCNNCLKLIQRITEKMLYYKRISLSEGINTNKTGNDVSKLCDICCFYFYKNKNCNYEPYICDRCHGASQRTTNLN